jgi:diguanylate cyclase (GGDEF)-like protein
MSRLRISPPLRINGAGKREFPVRHYHSLQAGAEHTAALLGTEDHLLRARIPEPNPDNWEKPTETPLWAALAQAPSGTYESASAFDGIRRLFTYRQVDDLPLVMVVGFSVGDLNDRVVVRIGWLWPVAGVITLLFLALTGLAASVLRAQERLATANAALRNLALFDALTGLPSRILFTDRLERSLLLTERNQTSCALMYLDLDDFKMINDTAGHEAGDQVLREVSQRMVGAVRATDTICRWGGDEFLILISHPSSLAELIEVARRLIAHISEPIPIKEESRRVSASIGIARFPTEGQTPAALHAAADAALYRAKREGKGRVVLAADLVRKSELAALGGPG